MTLLKYSACIIMLFAFFSGCSFDKNELPQPASDCIVDAANISWDNSINSLIQQKCSIAGCHVTEAEGGNGFDFRTYAGVKEKVNNGTFSDRVFIVRDMPPDGSPALSACELAQLKAWVDNGAIK